MSEAVVEPVTIQQSQPGTLTLGAVAIGRNEGERLQRCLISLVDKVQALVYVDSGSTDGSVEFARSLGVDVVELDMSQPFTMARGRNAGWRRLIEKHPGIDVVQFVDGDCEVVDGWLQAGLAFLTEHAEAGVVSGRRRERFRNKTVYNRLADMEWDTPVGEVRAVLGDMMVRVEAIQKVDGFNPAVIAAEDDEVCIRIRQAGWTVHRLEAEMSLHDANLTRFGQFFTRMVRAGHGFAEGRAMHGAPPERHFVAEVRRTWLWGLALPVIAVLPAWPTSGLSLLLLLLYPVSLVRTWRSRVKRGDTPRDAGAYAGLMLVSKFASLWGILTYYKRRLLNQRPQIIEYK